MKTIKAPTREQLKTWSFWKPLAFVGGGVAAGFLYYWFVGCSSGSCPITSNPYISMIWGGLMGFFLNSSPCANNNCEVK